MYNVNVFVKSWIKQPWFPITFKVGGKRPTGPIGWLRLLQILMPMQFWSANWCPWSERCRDDSILTICACTNKASVETSRTGGREVLRCNSETASARYNLSIRSEALGVRFLYASLTNLPICYASNNAAILAWQMRWAERAGMSRWRGPIVALPMLSQFSILYSQRLGTVLRLRWRARRRYDVELHALWSRLQALERRLMPLKSYTREYCIDELLTVFHLLSSLFASTLRLSFVNWFQ